MVELVFPCVLGVVSETRSTLDFRTALVRLKSPHSFSSVSCHVYLVLPCITMLHLSSTGGGKWAASIACSACLPSPVLHLYCIEELACSLFPASLGSSTYFVALPVGSPKIIVLGINWIQTLEANTLHSLRTSTHKID